MEKQDREICLRRLEGEFSVCKVPDYAGIDLNAPWFFTGATDGERSLVCRTERVPANTLAREDGWKGFGICGALDFSLIGILSGIAAALAREKIGIFAVSTFDTDYIFVKRADYDRAAAALKGAGYGVE